MNCIPGSVNVPANVAPHIPKLETPGASSRAAGSDATNAATTHPFFSLLDWLTNDVLAADVADHNTRPPRKEDKTGQQDSQGVLPIELSKPPAQIKPPIVLDQPNGIALSDQAADTEQAAPIQAEPVGTPVTPSNLAFGAVLTERTSAPKEVVAEANGGTTCERIEYAPQSSSVNDIKPGTTIPAIDAKAGPDDRAGHNPEQAAQNTKDPAPEKLVRTPAASDPPAHASIVSVATESKLERPQDNSSTKLEPSDPPKAELKTEINTAVRPQPTREISLKLTGTDAGSVDVRISERAGKVQVDVRTSDGELARSLRSDLGDLVGRLEKRGFDAQTWTPGGQAASTASGSSRPDANSDRDSQQSAGGTGQHGQNQNHDDRQKQHQRLEFLRKFESSMSFNTSSSIPEENKENYVNTGN